MCNLAFFPLFPVVWKISQLDAAGVCVINISLFVSAFIILMGRSKYPVIYLLVLTTFPSFIFFFLPYSESLFFLSGTLLILGYRNNSRGMIIAGLLCCGMIRAVSTIFIPAVIFTELICYRKAGKNMWTYTLVCIVTILGVAAVQALQTGKWFYFLGVQKYWNRHFQLPGLPFTTEAPERVIGVDAIGLFIGVIAAFICIRWMIQKAKVPVCRSVIFSCLYLAGVAFLDSFFTDDFEGHTKLWSMNRHIIATPFFLCFLNWFYHIYQPEKTDKYIIPLIILSAVFLTTITKYPFHLLYYLLFFTALIVAPFISERFRTYLLYPLYGMQVFLLFVFYQSFLYDKWIG
jgi:hypothetical protein